MTTTTKVYKDLTRIIDLATTKVDDKIYENLSKYRIVDQMPSGIPLMEDVIRDYLFGDKYIGGENVLVSARVGDLYGDPTYNCVEDINYNNWAEQIRNDGGFTFFAADGPSAFLGTNGNVACNNGTQRITMRFRIDQDEDARVNISLKLHRKESAIEEILIVEAKDHTFDCS